MIITTPLGKLLNFFHSGPSVEPITTLTNNTKQNALQIQEPCSLRFWLDKYNIHLWTCNNNFLKFFHQNKLKAKLNIYDYNFNEELELQIFFYENKNWNVISWYNISIKLMLKTNMIIFLWKILIWYLQNQKSTTTTSCKIWIFQSYTIRLSCQYKNIKTSLLADAISFSENLKWNSTNSLPFENHCNDVYSIPLISEHHDSYLYYIHYKTCESSYADVPFSVVFLHPIKNINTGFFWKAIKPKTFCHQSRLYLYVFWINYKKLMNFYNNL